MGNVLSKDVQDIVELMRTNGLASAVLRELPPLGDKTRVSHAALLANYTPMKSYADVNTAVTDLIQRRAADCFMVIGQGYCYYRTPTGAEAVEVYEEQHIRSRPCRIPT